MNIGILAIAERMSGGIYQYTHTLIESLVRYNNQKFLIIKKNESSVSEEYGIDNNSNFTEVTTRPFNLTQKIQKILNLFLPISRSFFNVSNSYAYLKDYNLDLIISPVISFFPIFADFPYIVTIHDLIHMHHPEFLPAKEIYIRKITYKIIAKNAVLVVCESNAVKQDINKYLDIPNERIRIIPSPPQRNNILLSPDPQKEKKIREQYNLPSKFLFYPAQFWPHKNHKNLVKAIHFIKQVYNEDVRLILVGSKKDSFQNIMDEIKSLKLEDKIQYLGYVPDEDMPYLYKLATALVMPTFFESLSIPIWEAFYFGLPVASSNVCALPEQVMDAGLIFDPNNIKDISEKIYLIWTNKNKREELTQKGHKRIQEMTLENYSKQWAEIIDEAFDIIQNS